MNVADDDECVRGCNCRDSDRYVECGSNIVSDGYGVGHVVDDWRCDVGIVKYVSTSDDKWADMCQQ